MDIGKLIAEILVSLIAVGIIGHMAFILFRKKFRENYTADEFRNLRIEQGKDECSSEEENTEAWKLMSTIMEEWPVIGNDEETGEEIKAPLKQKQVASAELHLKTAIELAPTTDELVHEINETARVVNMANKRQFNGSKRFIVIVAIIAVLFGVAGSWAIFGTLIFSSLVYILASMSPSFILHKRMLKGNEGRSSFMSSLFAGIFGAVATATTYKVTTKYSDGTKDTSYDYTETWVSLALAVIISLFVAFFMWAIAIINYLRNYVLYV